MDPTGQPMVDTLLGVVATLQAELEAQREQAAESRREAAESRREIARLVAMVEGLTAQLDVLLRDKAEERRAELARVREEARAALEGLRLCTLLTLVATCRLQKVDPYQYLEWALSRVVPHRNNRRITASDLTPAAYKAAKESDAQ